MTVTWEEFSQAVTDKRFLLPVDTFIFEIEYVQTRLTQDQVPMLANWATSCVLESLRIFPDTDLSSLRVEINSPEAKLMRGTQESFFSVIYEGPVYGFMLQVGPTLTRFSKQRTSLRNLIACVPLFEDLCARLFGTDENPPIQGELISGSLLTELFELRTRIHQHQIYFGLEVEIGTHITERAREGTNSEILAKLLRSDLPPGPNPDRAHPLAAFQAEELLRGDCSLVLNKELEGKMRAVAINVSAPHNISKKEVNLSFSLRNGGPRRVVDLPDLLDWRTPFVSFYRDIVLSRFFPGLFFDLDVSARL